MWTIKRRLLLLSFIGTAPLALLAMIGYVTVAQLQSRQAATIVSTTSLRNHNEADMMHDAIRADVLEAVNAATPEALATAQSDAGEHAGRMRNALARNEGLSLDKDIRAALNDLKPSMAAYLQESDSIIALAERDRTQAQARLPQFRQSFDALDRAQDRVADLIERKDRAVVADSAGAATTAKVVMAGISALAFIGLLVASIRMTRSISAALGARIDLIRRTSDSVASASAQIAASSQTLAHGASDQAASLEETSAAGQEVSSITRANAQKAQEAAACMTQASEDINRAGRTMDELLRSMIELNESSEKISRIMKVIDEIAFQTNILALNAAVEAARAGDAGLGFSVVADEVRNLAQRCTQAARETAVLIEDSVAKSLGGRTKVDQVVQAITSVTTSAGQVKALVEAVSAASLEQTHGIDEMSQRLVQMESVTQSTAATAEESAATSSALKEQSTSLHHVVEQLLALVGETKTGTLAVDEMVRATSHVLSQTGHHA